MPRPIHTAFGPPRDGLRFVDLGAALKPVRGTHSIIWTANDRDGRVKRFKLPIRTTPWGSIEPYPDDARPDSLDLKSTTRFGESKYLGVDRLPTPGAASDPDQRELLGDAMDRPETEVVDCDVPIVSGGMSGCAANIWRPHAVGEGGVFRGSHAIGPCVDNNWLTLG